MSEQALPTRSSFRNWFRETCRYGDTDRQGHVNNAVFATFCESGRVAFLRGGEAPVVPGGYELVVVRLTINFRQELHWGDAVDIGTEVVRLGNTSLTTGQGLFRGEDCVATAESVLVLVDGHTRRPVPLLPELRARWGKQA